MKSEKARQELEDGSWKVEVDCEGEEFDLPYHAVRVDVAQYFVMEYHCKEAICSKRNKCDASCVIAQYFIQKLTENENDD